MRRTCDISLGDEFGSSTTLLLAKLKLASAVIASESPLSTDNMSVLQPGSAPYLLDGMYQSVLGEMRYPSSVLLILFFL